MERTLTLYGSTVGKKVAMAVSGIVMLGFTVGHMLGNLQVFAGPETFNEYAVWIRQNPALMWGTRIIVFAAFSVHFASALALWQKNKDAGGGAGRYKMPPSRDGEDAFAYYARRTMYWTGPILFIYIAFHLVHLTLGGMIFGEGNILLIEGYTWEASNPYNNLVRGMQHWPVAGLYIVAMLAYGAHIYHGLYSLFQSLGLNHPKYNNARRDLAVLLTLALVLGFISIPASVLFGSLEPTTMTFNYPELQ